MTTIAFTVYGVPAPQGSKVRNRWGGVREDNPATMPWRGTVTAKGAEAMAGEQPLSGAVWVRAIFTFTRPPSHYRTGRNAHLLRDSSPVFHVGTPDIDKLQRAVGDALTGTVLRDDKQIVIWLAAKAYGAPARLDLEITQLDLDTAIADFINRRPAKGGNALYGDVRA